VGGQLKIAPTVTFELPALEVNPLLEVGEDPSVIEQLFGPAALTARIGVQL